MSSDLLPDVGAHPDRLVALSAVHNFRDLGGYPTANGRTTKWRTLFRADGLNRLTAADLEVVRGFGLRTVIDLRTDNELKRHGRFPQDRHPVDFHQLSVLDQTWDQMVRPDFEDPADFLHWAYTKMLVSGAVNFANAITTLAAPEALPAVFHCAAGKDRTGILAALLLGSLGVPHDYIAADYGLTAAGIARMRAWAEREMPENFREMAETPSAFFAALPRAMSHLLADITEEYGDVRSFVLRLGVSEESLHVLADGLLETA
jgi:protein-tyrosine phosphatase